MPIHFCVFFNFKLKKYTKIIFALSEKTWFEAPPVDSDNPHTTQAPPILCSGKISLKRKQIRNPSPWVRPTQPLCPKVPRKKDPQRMNEAFHLSLRANFDKVVFQRKGSADHHHPLQGDERE